MSARRHIPPTLEGRVIQAPGMMRHGPFPAGHRTSEPLSRSDLLEHRLAAQAADIEQLAGDNNRLVTSHMALREDLAAAQQEVQRLNAHIRSIQTESDIQIRVLLDKIAKMEKDIRAGENVKKDLKQAHVEAQKLVKERQELATQIQQASHELQKIHTDVKSVPDLHAELENSRHELKRLRATFEYEKGLNIEKVEQMRAMEQNLIGMAREMENLRVDVLNAETRARAPNQYIGGYAYPDGYGRPCVHMGVGPAGEGIIPYNSSNSVASNVGFGGAAKSTTGGVAQWVGPFDPSHARG
ncbi:PREDICTED: protein FLX-like 4 [Populus euphratica]|uniref:Protein FLX-like 4 n=1 Tax=Populus euphratica TaxID=75702 RepID=A0AAJ6THA7_POPEU|nr:PREDICTED: protein FLX-like 4 [Populus euphratica]XP_011010509.1 PREDICTED: protein FLX-like 4 [Populus euphratica]XP_011010510.1 PREDICTED: protein FLX-like 4 [Populus euphratica]